VSVPEPSDDPPRFSNNPVDPYAGRLLPVCCPDEAEPDTRPQPESPAYILQVHEPEGWPPAVPRRGWSASGRAVLPDQLARPPLRHAEHSLQVLDGAAPAGRAHQFPRPSSLQGLDLELLAGHDPLQSGVLGSGRPRPGGVRLFEVTTVSLALASTSVSGAERRRPRPLSGKRLIEAVGGRIWGVQPPRPRLGLLLRPPARPRRASRRPLPRPPHRLSGPDPTAGRRTCWPRWS
jgi:hypothetical protein